MKYLPRSIREIHSVDKGASEVLNLIETEKKPLLSALERTSWNQTKAAEMLGISRKKFRTKMKHHGLFSE